LAFFILFLTGDGFLTGGFRNPLRDAMLGFNLCGRWESWSGELMGGLELSSEASS
jgi:hypothetical protein